MNIVQRFYNALPFNKAPDEIIQESIIKPGTPWPELNNCLSESKTVLELGCGNGWLSNRIAYNFAHIAVTGIDLIEENIAIANRLKQPNSNFSQESILENCDVADTVVSVGVLHHIPEKDIESLVSDAVTRANKYAFIGLYYKPARDAMWDFFNSVPEHRRYKYFKKMTPWFKDDNQRQSWYRDQLEHPYEVSVDQSLYETVAQRTGYKLTWVSDVDSYQKAAERLNRWEFTSGFIYGVFEK